LCDFGFARAIGECTINTTTISIQLEMANGDAIVCHNLLEIKCETKIYKYTCSVLPTSMDYVVV